MTAISLPFTLRLQPLRKAAGGLPVNPTPWAHPALGLGARVARPSFAHIGKPTGTYPKHFFKSGHPGNIAVLNAQRGIQPSMPPPVPAKPPGT
jgi:hypothetical protein